MKNIYEFEFEVTKKGKKYVVQQSETSQKNAERRIRNKISGIEHIKFFKRLSYPHYEGGMKAK